MLSNLSLVLWCRIMRSTVATLPLQAMASLRPWLHLRMEVSWAPMQAPCIPSKQPMVSHLDLLEILERVSTMPFCRACSVGT